MIGTGLAAATLALCPVSNFSESLATLEKTEPHVAPVAAPASAEDPAVAAEAIVGTTPPEWQTDRWLNSSPLRLTDLRGKVVLVRWWTAGCALCATSAPALREFHQTYGPRGLVVIGLYHHKGSGAFDPRVFVELAKEYAFTFPLAVDPDWRTLKSWARDAQGREVDTGWTSKTFVLDKKGVVRHVHPGGEYVKGDASYERLRTVFERLLAED